VSVGFRLFFHARLQVISNDPAPPGQPVVYALKGGPGEDVLRCMLNKSAAFAA